jgi:hypothetical protein
MREPRTTEHVTDVQRGRSAMRITTTVKERLDTADRLVTLARAALMSAEHWSDTTVGRVAAASAVERALSDVSQELYWLKNNVSAETLSTPAPDEDDEESTHSEPPVRDERE